MIGIFNLYTHLFLCYNCPYMRLFLRLLLLFTILLAGFTGIGLYWTFFKPLPDYEATLQIENLNAPVDVHWDSYGVPHIYAESQRDLYIATGYLHAQERLWQMTLSQMAAEGRFAEFLGEKLVPFDQYQRTIGLWETAQRIEREAPDSLMTLLNYYSEGVNRYIEANQKTLPVEFTLLEVTPIEWTPTHSIAVSRMMAWDQNVHWWTELTFAFLDEKLTPSQMQKLFPQYEDRYPTTLNDAQSRGVAEAALPLLRREMDLRNLLSKEGTHFGSNAWAVQGRKTESGQPLLAGDPHMGLSIPGYWFEMHHSAPGLQISGATIPGAPFIVLGQNNHLAWSITNMMADDIDFFVERVVPGNHSQYVADSTENGARLRDFEYREEIIKVRGADNQLYRIPSTDNGPVISTIHPEQTLLEDKRVTMKWTGHKISHELWALYQMNRAQSIEEFERAVSEFHTPAMNFIYADRNDNIAIFSGASLPVRNFNPLFFRPGWDSAYDWQESIPFDELPHLINPGKGFVAHANNKLHTDSYPHYIASFWEPPPRIIRINQFLEDSDSLNSHDMQLLQFDIVSEHTREITEFILPVLRSGSNTDRFREVLPYLENWDYQYDSNSTAATIFDQFFINLSKNLLEDDIGEEAYQNLIRLEHLPVMIVSRMLDDDTIFLNDETGVPNTDLRDRVIRQSMAETISQLNDRFGPETFDWRWEKVHTLTLRPPLLGDMAGEPETPGILKMVIDNLLSKGPYPAPGHGFTVNKGQYNWQNPFEMTLGPSIRRIVDFSTPGRSFSVLPTGQAGNPFSTHYGDQTQLWLEGRYRYIYQDSTFFNQTSYQSMKLIPAQ